MVDKVGFEYWHLTLQGKSLPIHENDPQEGWYRTRPRKGYRSLPVRIWRDEGSGELLALRDGKRVDPYEVWTWVCLNPVSVEAYEEVLERGRRWPDEVLGLSGGKQPKAAVSCTAGASSDRRNGLVPRSGLSGSQRMAGRLFQGGLKGQAGLLREGSALSTLTSSGRRAEADGSGLSSSLRGQGKTPLIGGPVSYDSASENEAKAGHRLRCLERHYSHSPWGLAGSHEDICHHVMGGDGKHNTSDTVTGDTNRPRDTVSDAWPKSDTRPKNDMRPEEARNLADECALLWSECSLWLEETGLIVDQVTADRCANYAEAFSDLEKKAEGFRTAQKKPILDQGRAIDARWKPIVSAAEDAKRQCKKAIEPFLIAETECLERELMEQLQAENGDLSVLGSMPISAKAGTFGRTISLRRVRKIVVSDRTALINHYHRDPRFVKDEMVQKLLAKLAEHDLQAGISVPGAQSIEEKVAA